MNTQQFTGKFEIELDHLTAEELAKLFHILNNSTHPNRHQFTTEITNAGINNCGKKEFWQYLAATA